MRIILVSVLLAFSCGLLAQSPDQQPLRSQDLQSENYSGPPLREVRGEFSDNSHAPYPQLPPLDSLTACISRRYQQQLVAELTNLQENNQGNWLKYLPTVGISYNATNSPFGPRGIAPTLSLNSNLIYAAKKDKQRRQAQREAIIQQFALQEARDVALLTRKYYRYQEQALKSNRYLDIADIETELFELYTRQLENHDITPEEYLLKKKAFLLQQLRQHDLAEQLTLLRYEIEDLANCLPLPPWGPGG